MRRTCGPLVKGPGAAERTGDHALLPHTEARAFEVERDAAAKVAAYPRLIQPPQTVDLHLGKLGGWSGIVEAGSEL
jgi:hypothetical protein